MEGLLDDIRKLKKMRKQLLKPKQIPQQDKQQSTTKTQKSPKQLQKDLEGTLSKIPQPLPMKRNENKSNYKPQFLSAQQQEINRRKQINVLKKQEKKTTPEDLFKDLYFCFPKYNSEVTQKRAATIKENTIQKYKGTVIDYQQILAYIQEMDQQNPQQYCPFINYLLVDKCLKREQIEQQVQENLIYDDILDVNYVFDCIKVGKILETDFYIIKKKEDEFYNEYIEKMRQNLKEDKKEKSQFTSFFTNTDGPNGLTQGDAKKMSNNQFIADSFQKLRQMYEKTDRGRAFAYARAASIVKSLNKQLKSHQDVDQLKGHRYLGPKTLAKIKQMINTGSLQRLNFMSGKQQNQAEQKLAKVWGIGKSSARQLYASGIKSVQQLRKAVIDQKVRLTKNQLIGLKYYEDLQQRIKRQEVTKIFQFIKKKFYQLVGTQQMHMIQVVGSYRRLRETCGDIDILITRNDGREQKSLVNDLVDSLTECGFLTDHLTMPRHVDPKSCISYMGICKFQDQIHHRLDIKLYPPQQYAYALLYFTGSGEFNRLMRLHAFRRGFRLSDHGMTPVARVTFTKHTVTGPDVICMTEEEIFKYLEFKYLKPEERCF